MTDDGLDKVIAQQAEMLQRFGALEKPRNKDVWDKLGALAGVIVALVGGLFSGVYGYYQAKQDAATKEHQAKIQQIQAAGAFMPYLASSDPQTRGIALLEVGDTLGARAAILAAKGINSSSPEKPDPTVVGYLQDLLNTERSEDRVLAANALSDIGVQRCKLPQFPSKPTSPLDETECALAGDGGAETAQNKAKNNFCALGSAEDSAKPIVTSIADLFALQTKVQRIPEINFGNYFQHPLSPEPGPIQDSGRDPLVALGEGRMVQLTGHVKIARQEGAESVNCGTNVPNDPAYHDIHISIVSNPADLECSGVVVEMSPRHRPALWTAVSVNKVLAAGLLVRVTGQLMFDSSHSPCDVNGKPVPGDPSRISLWEIHPVYSFEVCPQGDCAKGNWRSLEDWAWTPESATTLTPTQKTLPDTRQTPARSQTKSKAKPA